MHSMGKHSRLFFASLALPILAMPTAQAHGEGAATVSNSAILLISLTSSVFLWSIGREWLSTNSCIGSPLVFCLAIFSGITHVMLGLDDSLLIVGGIGVLGILAASLSPKLSSFNTQLRVGLAAIVGVMFVGYFVANHDLHYILEDYLGILTKIAELVLMQQLSSNYWKA